MKTNQPENPFLNLFINVLLPVLILNKGADYFGTNGSLALALVFPLAHGLYDYIRKGHKNYVSLLGVINTLLTGSLAWMKLEGIWFAVKEASLPFVLGIFVLASRWGANPAAKMMFCNPQVLNMELIEAELQRNGRSDQFEMLLKQTTVWLSISFFISALLNFVLAAQVFLPIDPGLASEVQEQILNEQIARMTWMGYVVIAVPLMVFSGVIVTLFLRKLSALSQLALQQLLK